MNDEINAALQHNVSEFMQHGPGLRTTTSTWICAVDEENGYVLVSGLGGMGVGTMWFGMTEADRNRTGFDDAPRVVTVAEEVLGWPDRVIISGDRDAAYARTAYGLMFPMPQGEQPA